MKKVKIGFIGLGQRGAAYGMTDGSIGLLGTVLNNTDDVIVTALCDKHQERLDAASAKVVAKGQPAPMQTKDYKDMLNPELVDGIIISTSWDMHVQVALEGMRAGISVAMEVGGTHSIEDCWKLVDCYEETGTPIFFMENCCYNKDEALVTSLVRNGKMGEIAYAQGYYAHDLREEISGGIDTGHYRLAEYRDYNCENYPTHELGPIAKILGITSGNRFTKLVSMSSKAIGLKHYIANNPKYSAPDRLGNVEFKQGDVTTTMIECENGETIFLKLDTTLPRLYERGVTVNGTKGFYNQTVQSVVLDGKYNHEGPFKQAFFNQDDYKDYLPDEWRTITEEQLKSGHGGMDFVMLKDFVSCLKDKKPFAIDVYDAVTWMCVTALSEQSIAMGSMPVECPDFTRGKYKTRKTVDCFKYPVVKD